MLTRVLTLVSLSILENAAFYAVLLPLLLPGMRRTQLSALVACVVATMGQGVTLGLASRAYPEQRVSALLVALCAQSTPCARTEEARTGG